MTNRLAIGIVLGALVAAGAGYLVLRTVFTQRGPQTSTQQTPRTGNVIVPIVVTTTPTSSAAQGQGQATSTIQVASVEEAYQNLLLQLQAQAIVFDTVSASGGAYGPVYKLYADDIATAKKIFPKAKDFSLRMASVDLNDDGTDEVLVYEDLPGFCGTAGCPFDVYQKKLGDWQQLFSRLSIGEPALANVFTDGYRDLFISVQVDGYVSNMVQYVWNGKTYGPQRAVAT